MAANQIPYITEEQYLELERKSDVRHEYYRGEMFAMSGGTGDHSFLAAELISELRFALRGSCRVATSDLKIYVPSTGLYTYPDISVTCEKPSYLDKSNDTLLNPLVVVEVLSPSSGSYDRGEKFRQYQTVPSIKTYILVSCDRMRIETYTRGTGATWIYRAYDGADAVLEIEEPAVSIPLQSIYRSVEFPQP
ncbi:MAG: Uma2 family endonuclease [Bryobacterales bacterium]|nr:Uma2 family endonuclease [Bryobacterales bacterium]